MFCFYLFILFNRCFGMPELLNAQCLVSCSMQCFSHNCPYGYGLSVNEKWANLCRARRWLTHSFKTVERWLDPQSNNVHAQFFYEHGEDDSS